MQICMYPFATFISLLINISTATSNSVYKLNNNNNAKKKKLKLQINTKKKFRKCDIIKGSLDVNYACIINRVNMKRIEVDG